MTVFHRTLRTKLSNAAALVVLGIPAAWPAHAQEAPAAPAETTVGGVKITGIPNDWSFRHLVFSNPGTCCGKPRQWLPREVSVGRSPHALIGGAKNDLAVGGVHHDGADLVAQKRSHDVGPGGAGVSGFQDARTVVAVAGEVLLAGTDVNDIRIGGVEGDGSDRDGWLSVKGIQVAPPSAVFRRRPRRRPYKRCRYSGDRWR